MAGKTEALRVAFLTQGPNVPAARFRAEQLIPFLNRQGMACTSIPCWPSVYGDTGWNWVHGWRRELFRPFSIINRLLQLPRLREFDVLYLQRPMIEYYTALFEEIVTRFKPSVFDLDDAIFHNRFGWERFKVRRIVDLVRHVVVGNQYLLEFVARPDKCTLIPTVVDVGRYKRREDPEGPLTIGWTGSHVNISELRSILVPLDRVLRECKARLRIIADRTDPCLSDLPVEFVRWSPAIEVSALDGVHVGIMPLADTPYNLGKCGFKLIQFMACAIPVVASPVGANAQIVRHGIDGFLPTSLDGWAEALFALARERELRKRMGDSGRLRVEQQYSVEAVLPLYREVFSKVVS